MPKSPREHAPLGLPPGSIRALLSLLIVLVIVIQMVRGEDVGAVWQQTVMIALAHYFTSRRLINLPPQTQRKLEAEGILEKEPHPLYLPRHSIRVLIIAAFVGLSIYLRYAGRLVASESLGLLINVFAYFLGMLSRPVVHWLTRKRKKPATRAWWPDIKAAVALLLIGGIAAAHLLGWHSALPKLVDDIAIGYTLFYFGSR